jgi:hypothetical protein
MIIGLILGDILMAVAFALKFNHLPQQIPLFYSRTWGEDQLADLWMIGLLPVLLHIFVLVNIWISKRYFSESEFMKKLIMICNWFLIITFTGVFLKIILLVS